MSRVGDNHELLTLQKTVLTRPDHRCFVIQSNSDPDAAGSEFWKVFRNGKDKLKNAAADFVFQADNDLVVDTASKTEIQGFEKGACFDFGTNGRVHHANYSEQPETATISAKRFLNDGRQSVAISTETTRLIIFTDSGDTLISHRIPAGSKNCRGVTPAQASPVPDKNVLTVDPGATPYLA